MNEMRTKEKSNSQKKLQKQRQHTHTRNHFFLPSIERHEHTNTLNFNGISSEKGNEYIHTCTTDYCQHKIVANLVNHLVVDSIKIMKCKSHCNVGRSSMNFEFTIL